MVTVDKSMFATGEFPPLVPSAEMQTIRVTIDRSAPRWTGLACPRQRRASWTTLDRDPNQSPIAYVRLGRNLELRSISGVVVVRTAYVRMHRILLRTIYVPSEESTYPIRGTVHLVILVVVWVPV